MRKPSILTGAIWGGLLTIPLMALSFLGTQVAEFPFIPSLVFNTVRDLTPGALITATIDTMITVITGLNLGRLDTAAKTAEEFMSLGMVFVIGVIVGALYFVIMRRQSKNMGAIPGIVCGAILGVLLALIVLTGAPFFAADRTVSAAWVFGLSLLYGLALNYVYNMLAFGVRETRTVIPAGSGAMRGDTALVSASTELVDRRSFLVRVGAGTAAVTVVGAGLGSLLRRDLDAVPEVVSNVTDGANASAGAQSTAEAVAQATDEALPNANDPVVAAEGTRPEVTPLDQHYRIDIATQPPNVREADYTLLIADRTGDANTALREFTLDEVRALPAREDYLTMGCISNRVGGSLISTIKWTGVTMQRFLEEVEVPEAATHIRITSADGFDEIVSLEQIANDERIMLAWAWDDQPLLQKHGFPLRIHIPNHYGMKQPKWILTMEFITGDQDGYWVRRGWSKEAIVKTTSVIDTVAVDMMIVDGERRLIPVGGIAWAGARGIESVEVRVDEGEWQMAQLRAPISDRTWTVWRYDWEYSEGEHLFEVRCTDGTGDLQTERIEPPRPDGSSGLHFMRARV